MTTQPATRATFTDKENNMRTVDKYWAEAYGPLKFPFLPCLDVSKGRKTTFLPPEVCETVAGQRQQKLTEEQTRSVISYAAAKPGERRKSILATLDKANLTEDSAVRAFGVKIDKRMITVHIYHL